MKPVLRHMLLCVCVITASLVGLFPVTSALAQGIIIEPPPQQPLPPIISGPITIDLHQVDVVLDGPVATVHVTQQFRNQSSQTVEGSYVFPLPADAAVGDFQMTVDGQVLEGKLFPKDEARRIYEETVRRQRDPALLEYLGRGLFQTSVFPIGPGETRKLELSYTQALRQEAGLYHFRYPLRTQHYSAAPVQSLSIHVELRNEPGLRTIYSPSHAVSIERTGNSSATVGWEASREQPDSDFDLFFGVANQAIGVNLLSYKPAGEEGYFALMAAPDVRVAHDQVVARDIIVVLDVSGSMKGKKIDQARQAAGYIVDHLNVDDRFNLISFSTGVSLWQNDLQRVSDTSVESAHQWIDRLEATGSTDINRAVLEALGQLNGESPQLAHRPAYILFMTDGLPTQGETDAARIVDNATKNAPMGRAMRMYTFGVGYDVNTDLLDALSRQLGGRSSYVRPDEQIDEAIGQFYANVSTPVLADVSFTLGTGIVVDDVYPYPLPDLFAGEQLVVVGRYHGGGAATPALKGTVNGASITYQYPGQTLVTAGGESFVARLWATRKIGALMDQVRRNGASDEVVNAIVDLSLKFGIVTPYTSYLVQEPRPLTALAPVARGSANNSTQGQVQAGPQAPQDLRPAAKEAASAAAQSAAAAPASGAAAVAASQERNALETAATVQEHENVRFVNGKTFVQQGLIQAASGEAVGFWVDTVYTNAMPLENVVFGSAQYFQLASDSDMAQWLAISPEMVIVEANGTALRITAQEGNHVDQLPTSPLLTPAPNATPMPSRERNAWQRLWDWLLRPGTTN